MKHQFKPFDQVLVRDSNQSIWKDELKQFIENAVIKKQKHSMVYSNL